MRKGVADKHLGGDAVPFLKTSIVNTNEGVERRGKRRLQSRREKKTLELGDRSFLREGCARAWEKTTARALGGGEKPRIRRCLPPSQWPQQKKVKGELFLGKGREGGGLQEESHLVKERKKREREILGWGRKSRSIAIRAKGQTFNMKGD